MNGDRLLVLRYIFEIVCNWIVKRDFLLSLQLNYGSTGELFGNGADGKYGLIIKDSFPLSFGISISLGENDLILSPDNQSP